MEFERGMIVRIKSRTPLGMNKQFQVGTEHLVYFPEEGITWIGFIDKKIFDIFHLKPVDHTLYRYNIFDVDRVMNCDIEFVRWFEYAKVTNASAENLLPDFEEDMVR